MLPPAVEVTPEIARRFHRRAVLLDERVPGVGVALDHLGYVQIDPVNVCGRMHDLILRNRVAGYREGDLMRHLHGEDAALPPEQRRAFEHHLPSSAVLVAFPLEAWPHLLGAMKARTRRSGAWSGWLTPRERELAARILAEMAERGAMSSEDVQDERRGRRVWGSATLGKTTLQKLFFHGRVLIARRDNNRRIYDLPEKVLPAQVLGRRAPSEEETARWLVSTKLRQRRLATLKRDELPLVEDRVQPVKVAGCPMLYCLREDLPMLEEAAVSGGAGRTGLAISVDDRGAAGRRPRAAQAAPLRGSLPAPSGGPAQTRPPGGAEPTDVRLLAPLDPLIYDRRVTRTLWDFDYTWEVYTPAHKRVRGHYSLPVLSGTELAGHVDPKADRSARRLELAAKKVRRGHRVAAALRDLADFLGLRRQ